jgi:hypothetical protein
MYNNGFERKLALGNSSQAGLTILWLPCTIWPPLMVTLLLLAAARSAESNEVAQSWMALFMHDCVSSTTLWLFSSIVRRQRCRALSATRPSFWKVMLAETRTSSPDTPPLLSCNHKHRPILAATIFQLNYPI